MKYFVDFEANPNNGKPIITQIGCIDEHGEKFRCNISAENNELMMFITGGATYNDAFVKFYDYILNTIDDRKTEFYFWGCCDISYIKNTIKRVSDYRAIMVLKFVLKNYVDFHKKFCDEHYIVGLKLEDAIKKINPGYKQHHDALEDAQFLQIVYLYSDIKSVFPKVKNNKISNNKGTAKEQVNNNFEKIIAYIPNEFEMSFSSVDQAVGWVKRVLKPDTKRSHITSNLTRLILADKRYCEYGGCYWKGIKGGC